ESDGVARFQLGQQCWILHHIDQRHGRQLELANGSMLQCDLAGRRIDAAHLTLDRSAGRCHRDRASEYGSNEGPACSPLLYVKTHCLALWKSSLILPSWWRGNDEPTVHV